MSKHILHAIATGCALVLILSVNAFAHRVNIFAWAEGGAVIVESSFNSGNPARNSKVTVVDAADGTVLAEGTTDDTGRASFPVTDALRKRNATLRFELQAGEGHRNTWELAPDEYLTTNGAAPAKSTGTTTQPPATAISGTASSTVPPTTPSVAQAEVQASLQAGTPLMTDEATLRRIVDQALEAKLAPLRHSLAASSAGGPRLPEILGGIGYLVGMAGLLLWARSRRR